MVSGIPNAAVQLAQIVRGVADARAGAESRPKVESSPGVEPRPAALKLLEQAEGRTGAPSQGREAERQRQAGEGVAEQISKQPQRGAGLAGLPLAADLQGGPGRARKRAGP